ncbi:hypothetical protein B0H21DRAFT_819842 [Amylocystis lapponica]|nr:hypothetical protein B0H21DRAFT_819842 [Amylocystis lapponica]
MASFGDRNYVEDIRSSIDGVPIMDNVCMAILRWILLGRFVLLPPAFMELQKDVHETWVQDVSNVPQSLALVGWIIADLSVFGMLHYWRKHSDKYVWLLESIFIPTFFEALSGVLSAGINIYAGDWKLTSSSATALLVSTAAVLVCGALAWRYSRKVAVKKFHHHVQSGTTASYENRLIEYREKSLAVWMPLLFSWMILAGFILLPGSLKTELDSDETLVFRSTPM